MDKKSQLQSLSIDRSHSDNTNSVWPVLIAIVLAATIAAFVTWWLMNGKLQTALQAAEQANIIARQKDEVVSPTTKRASGMVASGYVVARRQATVSAEITGTIREILFEEAHWSPKDRY